MPTKMPNVIEHDAIIAEGPDRMKGKVWLQVQHLVNETFRHLHEAASARGLLNSYSILRGPYHFYITLDDEDGLVISFSVRFKHEPQRIYAHDIRKHSIRGIGTSNVGNDSLEEHVKMSNAKFIRFRPWEFEADKKFREYAKVKVEEFLSMLELSDSQNSSTKDEKDSVKWYQTNTFKFVVIPLVVALFLGIPAWLSIGNKTDEEMVKKLEEQVQKAKEIALPPTLSLVQQKVEITKTDSGYTALLVFKPSKNKHLGQIALIAKVIGESSGKIVDFWPRAGPAFLTGEDSKKISADGKKAWLIFQLIGVGNPQVELKMSEASRVQISSSHIPEPFFVDIE